MNRVLGFVAILEGIYILLFFLIIELFFYFFCLNGDFFIWAVQACFQFPIVIGIDRLRDLCWLGYIFVKLLLRLVTGELEWLFVFFLGFYFIIIYDFLFMMIYLFPPRCWFLVFALYLCFLFHGIFVIFSNYDWVLVGSCFGGVFCFSCWLSIELNPFDDLALVCYTPAGFATIWLVSSSHCIRMNFTQPSKAAALHVYHLNSLLYG